MSISEVTASELAQILSIFKRYGRTLGVAQTAHLMGRITNTSWVQDRLLVMSAEPTKTTNPVFHKAELRPFHRTLVQTDYRWNLRPDPAGKVREGQRVFFFGFLGANPKIRIATVEKVLEGSRFRTDVDVDICFWQREFYYSKGVYALSQAEAIASLKVMLQVKADGLARVWQGMQDMLSKMG